MSPGGPGLAGSKHQKGPRTLPDPPIGGDHAAFLGSVHLLAVQAGLLDKEGVPCPGQGLEAVLGHLPIVAPIVDGNIEGMQFVVATPENCFTDREIPEFQITAGAACVLAFR